MADTGYRRKGKGALILITDELRQINKNMGKIFSGKGILTNTSLQIRSCGCNLLTFNFEGLILSTWNEREEEAVKLVDSTAFIWDLVYLDSFPGTNMIRRAAFRRFCSHCRENYKLEDAIGMGSMVCKDRTG